MNAYLVYVNGLLAGPDLFEIKALNSSELGRYLCAEVANDERLKEIKTLDILEVRASNVVGRYRADNTGVEKGPHKTVVQCRRVENSF